MIRRMRRTGVTLCLTLLLVPWSSGADQADLRLKISYTGSGLVNDEHRIWIFIWDTPDFTLSRPIAFRSLTENGAEIEISGLRASPIYITCVYDTEGGYDPYVAFGPPPVGSPRGAWTGDPRGPGPAPVELEEGGTVSLEFSFRD
jgi:hypothetical protein